MGKGLLYRWEDNNHGLEHKCGTCQTVLSSPRAKKTCFGVHEEVCIKYHKTLFFLGMSHKCDACCTSREVHDKRHREIATLVQAIQLIDSVQHSTVSPASHRQRRTASGEKGGSARDDSSTADEPILDGEWEESTDLAIEDDAPTIDPISDKNNLASKKAQRAMRKVAKNQTRFNIITTEDVSKVDAALHPCQIASNGHGGESLDPLANSTIEANIAFNSNTFRYSSLRRDVHTKKVMKNNGPGRVDEMEVQVQEAAKLAIILQRLGITTNVLHNTRERKGLLSKLQDAIKDDLDCVSNEDRDTMIRMAGYWRYANRRTYNVMVRNNQLWDWMTGAKLEEVEEEEEEDDISSLDERFSEMSTAATTPVMLHFSPDTDSCSDFDLCAIKTSSVSEIRVASEAIDDEKTPTRSTFSAQPDTRHLQTPTRIIAGAAPALAPAPLRALLKTPNAWDCKPMIHCDANNRFSPLAAISEEAVAPNDPTENAPRQRHITVLNNIARHRSPTRKVLFPSRRRSPSPNKGRRRSPSPTKARRPLRGGLGAAAFPQLVGPTRKATKPMKPINATKATITAGQTYANMAKHGL